MRSRGLACVIGFTVFAAQDFRPARFSSGSLPLPPPQVVGWSEVVLHATVSAAGVVEKVAALRGTEPLTGILLAAVDEWRFEPAMLAGERVNAQVLVAAVYRPPTLLNTPGLGQPPRDLTAPSGEAPFPTVTSPPAYPANALGDGVVLVEVLVGTSGEVKAATVIRSSGTGFNSSAIQAATEWRLRPALREKVPVPSFAYLVFGFRQPVVVTRPRR
jgi:TonB family protein